MLIAFNSSSRHLYNYLFIIYGARNFYYPFLITVIHAQLANNIIVKCLWNCYQSKKYARMITPSFYIRYICEFIVNNWQNAREESFKYNVNIVTQKYAQLLCLFPQCGVKNEGFVITTNIVTIIQNLLDNSPGKKTQIRL